MNEYAFLRLGAGDNRVAESGTFEQATLSRLSSAAAVPLRCNEAWPAIVIANEFANDYTSPRFVLLRLTESVTFRGRLLHAGTYVLDEVTPLAFKSAQRH